MSLQSITKRARALIAVLAMVAMMLVALTSVANPAIATSSYITSDIANNAEGYADGAYGGECKQFVNNVVQDVTGISLSGYQQGFENAGATEITNPANAVRGDIIQITPTGSTDATAESMYGTTSSTRLHTAIIRAPRNADGTFDVIDSNWNLNEEVLRHSFNPYSWANGSIIKIWRFGSTGWKGVGSATYFGSDRLTLGQDLAAGQYLVSPNVQFALVLQSDGNLVLYHGAYAIWNSNTDGTGADRLAMQYDGNIVLYNGNTPVWETATDGQGVAYVAIQTDGNIVARTSGGNPVWASGTSGHTAYTYYGSDRISTGQHLQAGQYLRSSNGLYALLMQYDGNLVLYSPGYHVLWDSGTNNQGGSGSFLDVQYDGNVVIYASNGGSAIWAIGKVGATSFIMQTDGNGVVHNSAGSAVWATGTNGKI